MCSGIFCLVYGVNFIRSSDYYSHIENHRVDSKVRPVSQSEREKTHENNTGFGKSTSELLILKPEGYPLSGMLDEYPVIENRDVLNSMPGNSGMGMLPAKETISLTGGCFGFCLPNN